MKIKKNLNEVISVIKSLEKDNIDYIDNSGKRWLHFVKSRLYKLYGLSQEEIHEIIFKENNSMALRNGFFRTKEKGYTE